MTGFSDRVNKMMADMTPSQQKAASYYLSESNEAALSTLEEAAGKIGVSTTSIIRFARLLGYSGFSEMQKDLQRNLLHKAGLPERLDQLQNNSAIKGGMLLQSMQNDIDDITNTFASLDRATLQRTVELIGQAETVYILGLRSSFALAHYMMSRLAQIRPRVRLIQGDGMLFPEEFGGCGEKDLCIAFLFPRYSKTTSNLLLWLRQKKTPVILFTATQYDALKDHADYFLPCSISSLSFKNSFAAPISVINYLSAEVAISEQERAMETVTETERFLNMGYYLGL